MTTLLWNSYLSRSYPVIVVSVSWIRGMEISKKLSLRLCSGLALKETKISESEYFAYNYLCRSIFTFAVIFELLTFLLELRTATCHLLQRAELCQKSLQNDTAKTKKPRIIWGVIFSTMKSFLMRWSMSVCLTLNYSQQEAGYRGG